MTARQVRQLINRPRSTGELRWFEDGPDAWPGDWFESYRSGIAVMVFDGDDWQPRYRQ